MDERNFGLPIFFAYGFIFAVNHMSHQGTFKAIGLRIVYMNAMNIT